MCIKSLSIHSVVSLFPVWFGFGFSVLDIYMIHSDIDKIWFSYSFFGSVWFGSSVPNVSMLSSNVTRAKFHSL